ncbi:hypothetical protein CAOG_09121 [Capsaspora owczarzaki ATCC 30864]|uniref:hypothetical protein n=1 Tax=Capsaspora owczarzaki (strain ATCC 30864) TaxID=595528 RepID=UPI0003525996|nr:hypothetical protein CAOG_08953 [Capsaspora owczarzaki ATCC 30864]XP_011270774.1 hypothetical protein CAOG_09117 [Capsaspora owczarzaki ATCC 30864]XP_011270778.1 hypothetical protein CAOG_09121 [Capsaspora owczarzaki ATCC 30864]|eukprot:XP_011270624.1 hypothetical protein CAOG_08953 [Capsaspora owczarzaki ATCC 30864]
MAARRVGGGDDSAADKAYVSIAPPAPLINPGPQPGYVSLQINVEFPSSFKYSPMANALSSQELGAHRVKQRRRAEALETGRNILSTVKNTVVNQWPSDQTLWNEILSETKVTDDNDMTKRADALLTDLGLRWQRATRPADRRRILSTIAPFFQLKQLQPHFPGLEYRALTAARKHGKHNGPGVPAAHVVIPRNSRASAHDERILAFAMATGTASPTACTVDGQPVIYLNMTLNQIYKRFLAKYPGEGTKPIVSRSKFYDVLQSSGVTFGERKVKTGLCATCNRGVTIFREILPLLIHQASSAGAISLEMDERLCAFATLAEGHARTIASSAGKMEHHPHPLHCELFAFGLCHEEHNCFVDGHSSCPECAPLHELILQLNGALSGPNADLLKLACNDLVLVNAHHWRAAAAKADFNEALENLSEGRLMIVVDFKMKVLQSSAREVQVDFFGKHGFPYHGAVLLWMHQGVRHMHMLDHWSDVNRQDWVFVGHALEAIAGFTRSMIQHKRMPPITSAALYSDNGASYSNSALPVWIQRRFKLLSGFPITDIHHFEPGEGKSYCDTHFAAITHARMHWIRNGNDLMTGLDVEQAAQSVTNTTVMGINFSPSVLKHYGNKSPVSPIPGLDAAMHIVITDAGLEAYRIRDYRLLATWNATDHPDPFLPTFGASVSRAGIVLWSADSETHEALRADRDAALVDHCDFHSPPSSIISHEPHTPPHNSQQQPTAPGSPTLLRAFTQATPLHRNCVCPSACGAKFSSPDDLRAHTRMAHRSASPTTIAAAAFAAAADAAKPPSDVEDANEDDEDDEDDVNDHDEEDDEDDVNDHDEEDDEDEDEEDEYDDDDSDDDDHNHDEEDSRLRASIYPRDVPLYAQATLLQYTARTGRSLSVQRSWTAEERTSLAARLEVTPGYALITAPRRPRLPTAMTIFLRQRFDEGIDDPNRRHDNSVYKDFVQRFGVVQSALHSVTQQRIKSLFVSWANRRDSQAVNNRSPAEVLSPSAAAPRGRKRRRQNDEDIFFRADPHNDLDEAADNEHTSLPSFDDEGDYEPQARFVSVSSSQRRVRTRSSQQSPPPDDSD